MKAVFKVLIFLAGIMLLAAIAGGIFISKLNSPPDGMPDQTVFKVNNGDSAGDIAVNLVNQGLIRNSDFFRLYSRFNQTSGMIKTGLYSIEKDKTTAEIVNMLVKGEQELFKVTITEGLTSTAIAEILEKNGICDSSEFINYVKENNFEGFLYPDTYYFPKEYPAEKVAEYMKESFISVLEEIYPPYSDFNEDELYQKIIVASIVEREYRRAEEAPYIASVFYNRIEKNMYLGSCATVVYVITEIQGKPHPDKIYYQDLDIESPFNTYIHRGLPPGPICNPGKTALNAAFNPEHTDYLYFLLEDPQAGKHVFSKTLDEHNRSYELYIKGK